MSRSLAAIAVLALGLLVGCASRREIAPEAAPEPAPATEPHGVIGVLAALEPGTEIGIDRIVSSGDEPVPIGQLAGGIGSRSGSSASSGDPIILGALDKSIIDEVIRGNVEPVRDCYQMWLRKDRYLEGKLIVKFVIAKDGTVSSSVSKSDTLEEPKVAACVHEVMLGLRFPEPVGGGIVIVSYPFWFAPE